MEAQYKVGDKVILRYNDESMFQGDSVLYEEDSPTVIAEIIGIDPNDEATPYLIYSEQAAALPGSDYVPCGKVDSGQIKAFKMNPKWLESSYWWAKPHTVLGLAPVTAQIQTHVDGMNCLHCIENYHMAVPNTKDGRLLCYSCRQTEKWRYPELF